MHSEPVLTDLKSIEKLIEPAAEALGLDLVRVVMIGGKSDPTLQVMAERPDTRQLTIDDCADLSRRLSDMLDSADPIETAYRLEVSSPGIDRPLTRLKDYSDWRGHEARLRLAREVDGAKQVTGDIEGVEGETVLIAGSQGTRPIPFDAIHSAKLLLTDRLIAATQPLNAEGADDLETQEED